MDQNARTAKYEPGNTAEETYEATEFPEHWIRAMEFTKRFTLEAQGVSGIAYESPATFGEMVRLFIFLTGGAL